MCSANPSAQSGASRSWKLSMDASGEGVSWRMRAEAEIRCPEPRTRTRSTGCSSQGTGPGGRPGWAGGAQPSSLPPASCQGLPAPTGCNAPEGAQRVADVSWGSAVAETGEGAAGCDTRRSVPETAETPWRPRGLRGSGEAASAGPGKSAASRRHPQGQPGWKRVLQAPQR